MWHIEKSRGKSIFFDFFFKGTWKISFAQMVATATGVKNWCQFTFISYCVKNPSREVWRVYINKITSAF